MKQLTMNERVLELEALTHQQGEIINALRESLLAQGIPLDSPSRSTSRDTTQ